MAQGIFATTHIEPQWHTVRKTLYRVLIFVTKSLLQYGKTTKKFCSHKV